MTGTRRAFAEWGIGVALSSALLLVGAGLLSLDAAPSPAAAFLVEAPRSVGVFLGIGLAVWIALVLAANLLNRRRGPLAKFATNLAGAVAVAVLVILSWAVFAATAGGFAAMIAAIAFVHALVFVVACALGLAVTHFLFFRRRAAASAPDAAQSVH